MLQPSMIRASSRARPAASPYAASASSSRPSRSSAYPRLCSAAGSAAGLVGGLPERRGRLLPAGLPERDEPQVERGAAVGGPEIGHPAELAQRLVEHAAL